MSKFFRIVTINTFLVMSFFLSLINVNAATITETTKDDKYDTITDGTIVIGITKFESNEIVTSTKTVTAAGNFYRFYDDTSVDPTIYYYLGSWFELDEENEPTVVEDTSKLEELGIYYVNNVEKEIEVPCEIGLGEGYSLVFETNDSERNNDVKYENGKIKIPATLKEVKVIIKNDETKEEVLYEEFENVDDEFQTTTSEVDTFEELKEALLNKNVPKIEIMGDIPITEKLIVNHTVEINGNNHKLTAGDNSIFHITGDTDDEMPTAVLTIDNLDLINGNEVNIRVGTHHPVTAKETMLKVVIKENVYIESNKVGVLVIEKNATANVYGEIKINNAGAGIQGNGANNNEYYDGGTIVNIYPTAKITANNGSAIYIPQDGEVNISGGSLTGASAILLKSGKLNITAGTFEATGAYKTPIRNNNGGSATGDVIFVELNDSYVGGNTDGNIEINITGGTFISATGNVMRITNTSGTAATYIVNAKDLLSAKVDNSVIYDYEAITAYANNQTGLKDALLDKNVSEIELTSDIEITEKLIVNHTVEINGNDHKVSADGVTMFHVTGDSNDTKPTAVLTLDNIELVNTTDTCVQVGSKGKLTDKETDLKVIVKENAHLETGEIGVLLYSKNSTVDLYGSINILSNGAGIQGNGTNDEDENFGGTVVNIYETAKITTGATGIGLYIPQDGEVNIFGGEITSATPIALKSGKLNISGGTLTANGEYVTPIRNNNGADPTGDVIFVELNDGYIGGKTNDNIEITITGGTLTSENGNIIRVAKTTETVATYIVNAKDLLSAKVDNSVIYDYEAITAYANNQTGLKDALLDKNVSKIELTSDIEITEKLIVNHTVEINGNDHKVSADGVTMFHVTGDSNDTKPTAVLTLDNIELVNTTDTCVQVGSKGKLTDKETDLKVIVKENAHLETGEIGVLLYSKNSTVDLYGSINILSNGAGIQGNGTNDEDENFGGTVVNIYETAKITTGATGIGLYIPQDGEINIFGGEITSATPIALKSGKLNISGGTLTANGEYVTPIRNNNGADPTGDVIFVELNDGYIGGKTNDNIEITITGGTLTSENGNIIRASRTTENTATYVVNSDKLTKVTEDNSDLYN